jgi:hypothetical protein
MPEHTLGPAFLATPSTARSGRRDSRIVPPADADDLRVEHIAAQLEEAEQQSLADDWIERATLAPTRDRPHNPTGRRRAGGAAMTDRGRAPLPAQIDPPQRRRHAQRRSKDHDRPQPRPATRRLIAGDRVPEAGLSAQPKAAKPARLSEAPKINHGSAAKCVEEP